MADYKTDADRFYADLEQADRDRSHAEIVRQLVSALEARGVNVERLLKDLHTLKKNFENLGLAPAERTELIAEVLRRKLAQPVVSN